MWGVKDKHSGRTAPWTLAALVAVAAVDQLSKWIVVETLEPRTAVPVIGDVARFYLLRNSGAAFSLGENATVFLACLQAAAVVLCAVLAFRVRSPWSAAAAALIGGGAAGNLVDRLFRAPGGLRGHVVDFISVGDFAVFNLADSAITLGVVAYLVYALIVEPRSARPARSAQSAQSAQGEDR
ncbi:signal peptidase II [Corynebacterium bovis]|uniref:signal peptidase II n=1 Tax=Corynebacterium bovis TaxID=36808 RepID=UPI0035DD6EE8